MVDTPCDGAGSVGPMWGLEATGSGDLEHVLCAVVATANSGGGSLHVAGGAALLPGLVDGLGTVAEPDRVDAHLRRVGADLHIQVASAPRPPLVLAEACDEFPAHAVLVRDGADIGLADRANHLAWIDEAVRSERQRWRSRLALVAGLPEGAELTVTVGDGPGQDEPSLALTQGIRRFRSDRDDLLASRDLLLIFLAREALSIDDEAEQLLIRSALRRRITLWHWLAEFEPEPTQIAALLHEAVTGRDRDKTDAGRAIIDVSAMMLDTTTHGELVEALAASGYKHFSEAADEGADPEVVQLRLRSLHASTVSGEELRWRSNGELRRRAAIAATELLAEPRRRSVSRLLDRLGLERFARSSSGIRLRTDDDRLALDWPGTV